MLSLKCLTSIKNWVSLVSQRYAKANKPRTEGYIPEKPTTHLMYYDANNLYGWGMSQPLATSGFEWVNIATEKEIVCHPDDAKKGYILEYPNELHDSHIAYPLAPEQMRLKDEWMSVYQQNLLREIGGSLEPVKLVPNLRNKERYIVHYRNLKLYLSLGMRLKKMHRALRFDQRPWMEPYIRHNTELRKRATNDFEKDLFLEAVKNGGCEVPPF
jgi:hypothetical protein